MGEAAVATLPGRQCGTCSLCCKLPIVPETESPAGEWCRHCQVGKGCRIYAARPERCRAFHCGWLVWSAVPEHWFPAKARIIVSSEPARLVFDVDPAAPTRWREQPWHGEIKALAVMAFAEQRQVLVRIGRKVIAMLPDRDCELGVVADDEIVITGLRPDGTWGAAKVRQDDPRMALGGATIPLL